MSAPRRMSMRWHLRQVMATRSIFQTSDLVPLLAERGVNLSRQYVHKLVTTAPQRINTGLLAALCDILDCQPNDLLEPVAEQSEHARTGTDDAGEARPEGLGIGDLRPVRARVRRPHDERRTGGLRDAVRALRAERTRPVRHPQCRGLRHMPAEVPSRHRAVSGLW